MGDFGEKDAREVVGWSGVVVVVGVEMIRAWWRVHPGQMSGAGD